jgi:hypothetical protein
VRHVEVRGNRLICTTDAVPSPKDGVVTVVQGVWEKVPSDYLAPTANK